MTSKLLIEHLTIVLCAICIAIVAGLFLGVIAYLFPKARKVILNLADLLQTVPSLAMLGLIMIVIGAGKQTVIIGLALYSLLPIIRNTVLGLTEVSPAIKEAAMGCGMTKFQSLFQVELPMAFPVVFTGIRIATVNSISTAVFATFVGGGGIGSVIYRGIRIQNMGHDPLGHSRPDDHGDLLRYPDGLDRTPHDGEERPDPFPLNNKSPQ